MSLSRVLSTFLVIVVFAVSATLAVTANSDAQETTCPAGTQLAADGVSCLAPVVNDNVTVTTSCTVGVLSDDGQFCIVPRTDAPAPATPPTDAPVPSFTG